MASTSVGGVVPRGSHSRRSEAARRQTDRTPDGRRLAGQDRAARQLGLPDDNAVFSTGDAAPVPAATTRVAGWLWRIATFPGQQIFRSDFQRQERHQISSRLVSSDFRAFFLLSLLLITIYSLPSSLTFKKSVFNVRELINSQQARFDFQSSFINSSTHYQVYVFIANVYYEVFSFL